MVWPIRSKARSIASTMAALRPFTVPFMGLHRNLPPVSYMTRLGKADDETHLRLPPFLMRNPVTGLKPKVSSDSLGLIQENTLLKVDSLAETDDELDLFAEMERRFLSFKKQRYLAKSELFQSLSEAQSPKFMVIACADSRVCPSNILGFQPGEAFMIRNVANLVPPLQNGPSETNAALEFAVTTLGVEHILVIGHSGCGGIETLMKMQDGVVSSSFAQNWVVNAKVAKLRTQADAAHLSFDQQCRHCEKLSINHSLLNLLSYPWVEDRVRRHLLTIHGGYYNFLNCTFEKWTLDLNGSSNIDGNGDALPVKDVAFWH